MRTILLDGVTVTGNGSSVFVNGIAKHSVHVHFTNSGGSVTALTVDLEGSHDDAYYFQLETYAFDATDLTNEQTMFHVVNKAVNYVRANITTITETGTTAVYVYYQRGLN